MWMKSGDPDPKGVEAVPHTATVRPQAIRPEVQEVKAATIALDVVKPNTRQETDALQKVQPVPSVAKKVTTYLSVSPKPLLHQQE